MTTTKAKTAELLEQLDDVWQLMITWLPARSQPVTILYVRSNDALVTHDKLVTDSPALLPLRDPKDGQYTIAWAVSPEVKVNGLAIAVVRTATGAQQLVDSTGKKDRGELWSNSGGVTVNAP